MYCSNCGKEIREGAKFCYNCGAKICASNPKDMLSNDKNESEIHEKAMNLDSEQINNIETHQPVQTAAGKKRISGVITILVIFTIGVFLTKNILSTFVGKKSECETAEKEVKAVVLENYGEIPEIESKLLYDGGNRVVIIVRFKLNELGFDGSYAVVVSEKNEFVVGMTKELDYSYDYEAVLDEIKVLYHLD